MLVISCCAINRLSVSCPVFCVVECLIVKMVEKQFKISQIFSLLLFKNCLWLLWWIVPVKVWGGQVLVQGWGWGWLWLVGPVPTVFIADVVWAAVPPQLYPQTPARAGQGCSMCPLAAWGSTCAPPVGWIPLSFSLELAGSAIPCPLSGASSLGRKSSSWGELFY